MNIVDEVLNLDNWKLASLEVQCQDLESNKSVSNKSSQLWHNTENLVSPTDLYSYLKARFGIPNGYIMLLKNETSDNLIHWHYALHSVGHRIHIFGKSAGIEIVILELEKVIEENSWHQFITALNAQYRKYGEAMGKVKKSFEHWKLFVNPFLRVETIIQDSILELEELKLDESPQTALQSSDEYWAHLKVLTRNYRRAASLGTTIRMLCPVMAESFINLIIFVFRRDEYKDDKRMYDSLIRQQIDIRVKSLHINCTCFPQKIDCNNDAFKKFHTLMNLRNDFLHGNIDPHKLLVEDVWFDQKYIPIFEHDEGMILRMSKNMCTNVSREEAVTDFNIISNFIEMVLMSMNDSSLHDFMEIMTDRMPGINTVTHRLGRLFPSHQAESLVHDNKAIH